MDWNLIHLNTTPSKDAEWIQVARKEIELIQLICVRFPDYLAQSENTAYVCSKLYFRPNKFINDVSTFAYGNKLCGWPPQYPPAPASWPFDLESGVQIRSDLGYLCANFSLSRPLCFRLRPDVHSRRTDRQTLDAHHRLMPPPYGRWHNNFTYISQVFVIFCCWKLDAMSKIPK